MPSPTAVLTCLPFALQLGKRGASFCAAEINAAIAKKGYARIIIATGASQFEFLESLVQESVAWDKVDVFHLDEYIGLDETHKASFRGYLQERFFQKVSPKCRSANLLGGETGVVEFGADADAKIKAYGEKLLEDEMDLACIGIGENSHIAFNDPNLCDFNDANMVNVVPLDVKCRMQQVGEGWFNGLDDVPTHAMSLSCPAIMRCKVVSVHVPDARKAEAVLGTLNAPVSNACPGTLLRTHPNCRLWLDPPSASLL